MTNPDEAVEAVDRAAIRAVTATRFDIATMIDKYITAYRTILST